MRPSLHDYLKSTAPHLLPNLISPEALDHIARIAVLFPPVSAFGFECRLGEVSARADFGVRFLLSAGEGEILAGVAPARFTLEPFLWADPTWQRIRAFAGHWIESRGVMHDSIRDIFFEFDVDGPPPKIPIPSFFLELERHTDSTLEALDSALGILWGGTCSRPVRERLSHCLDALPAGAWCCSAGAMFSRRFNGVRLCLQDLAPRAIPAYLQHVGWPGALAGVEALLHWTPAHLTLCIDVGETVLPKVGLEVHIGGSLKNSKAEWSEFLRLLVDRGLCSPEKRHGMLAWIGHSHGRSSAADWPEHLCRTENTAGPDAVGVLLRIINHVKLTLAPGQPVEAKGYLGFVHTWLRYDKATRRYALGDLPGRDRVLVQNEVP